MPGDMKRNLQPCESPVEAECDVVDDKKGNSLDRANMYRMGKVQEMKVSV